MSSKFEILAAQVEADRDYGPDWSDTLIHILRLCHEYYDPSWDAAMLADFIGDCVFDVTKMDFGTEGAGVQTDEEIRAMRAAETAKWETRCETPSDTRSDTPSESEHKSDSEPDSESDTRPDLTLLELEE